MGRDDSRFHAVRVDTILELMEDLQISKTELARRTGISLRQINNILKGENDPREDSIVRIAAALGVKWRSLLAKHEGPPTPIGDSGSGGIAQKTTTDLLIETRNGPSPEELDRRLQLAFQKAGHALRNGAHVIRIIPLKADDEV